MSVVDASGVIRLILRFPGGESAERQIFDPGERSAAPDLLNAEVLHTLRRFERSGVIDRDESADAVRQLQHLPIVRYPTSTLLDRAWELRHNFSAYDAMYVALAEALVTPLVTADARLARAAREHSLARPVLLSL